MAARKKARKKARKGHKGHKRASTAKRGAARSKLKPGMVKRKPSKKALSHAKLRVTGYKLGRRKASKKKGKR